LAGLLRRVYGVAILFSLALKWVLDLTFLDGPIFGDQIPRRNLSSGHFVSFRPFAFRA
jgi:hypothetical protein